MLTLVAFVAALGVLIVIHELGHYLVARWCGVKVLRFSVGFGQSIWMRRYGADQTEWSIALIPLGGYVKMLDERETETPIAAHELSRAFNRQVVWKRMLIVLAGPVANLLLAVTLYVGLNWVGNQEPRARLAAPAANTPAALAGVQLGDEVLTVNAQPVRSWNDAINWITQSIGEQSPIVLEVQRTAAGARTNTHRLTLPAHRMVLEDLEQSGLKKLGLALAEGQPVFAEIPSGSRAAAAGLQVGDKVLAVNQQPIESASQFVVLLRSQPEIPQRLRLLRAGQQIEVVVTPKSERDEQTGQTIGRIGAPIEVERPMVLVRYQGMAALSQALSKTWETAVFSLRMLGKMLVGEVSLKNLSGPITIADYAGKTAQLGWFQYITFIALISISLGVLNLLPIPMLDGGHLLYYVLEILRGKALPEAFENLFQRIGLAFLLFVMGIALFNDLMRQDITRFLPK